MENKLYFLKMKIDNHPLFKDGLEFSLMSDARITENTRDQLTNLSGNLWINNLITIVGKNATGKTTIMKTIIGTLQLLYGDSIDQTSLQDVLVGDQPMTITTYFYGADNLVYKDVATFKLTNDNLKKKWIIDNELIYRKNLRKRFTKKEVLNFDNVKPIYERKNLGGLASSVLSPDDSIFRLVLSEEKYRYQPVIDNLMLANINALFYTAEKVPTAILNFLDSSIEYLNIESETDDANHIKKIVYHLKFKNSKEEITATGFDVIEHYLSSGTAKGITLYGQVMFALRTGGIIFIDELENHFNHAIVRSFIEDFADPKVNINRAILIFSTHYSELLNDLERGDEVYIAKRDEKIQLQRYSAADVRSDLKKAEVFESDYLGGTAPEYSAYMALKKATKKVVQNTDE